MGSLKSSPQCKTPAQALALQASMHSGTRCQSPLTFKGVLAVGSTAAPGGLFLSGTVDILSSGNVLSDFDRLLEGGLCLLDTEATPLHSVIKETCSSGSATLHVSWVGVVPRHLLGLPDPRGHCSRSLGVPRKPLLFSWRGTKEQLYTKDSPHILSLSAFIALLWGRVPAVVMLGQFSQVMVRLYMYFPVFFFFSTSR